ncbi:MAG: response regulator [Spirulinaceae cyanobacterium]
MRILLIDNDKTLINLLQRILTEQNYVIDAVTDGEQGWIYGSTYSYDLIILDWSLPKLDGVSLCKRFRASDYDTPILLLTASNSSQDKVQGLDAGADDCLCKPFDLEEFSARIRALLRRLNADFLSVLGWGDLKLDPCRGEVTYKDQLLSLTAKEYGLLELFLRHPQEVLSIEEIIESLWSSTEYPAEATVRSHLRHLRKKLRLAGLVENPITTLPGRGYCLKYLPRGSDVDEAVSSTQLENRKSRRSKHLATLTTTWERYQHKSSQQLVSLDAAIKALQQGNLDKSAHLNAIVTAHSLAGNLELFGFERGCQLTQEIEQLLQRDLGRDSQQIVQLQTTFNTLRQELVTEDNISEQISNQLEANSPLLLIIDNNTTFTENLSQEATSLGIRTAIAPTTELAKNYLEGELPDVVLLQISFEESTSNSRLRWERLSLIAEFKLMEPSIPVIVIADCDHPEDRLQIVRHGGSFFLKQPITAAQTLSFCQQVLEHSCQNKKVMIVDSDVELLRALPSMLQPWGFKLTTLDDPRQFWDVIQSVLPDILVLEIEMPHFSGIELCKTLRTYAYWRRTPILFLTAHTDIAMQNLVFSSGGDDFITKPIDGKKLAERILNRFERIRES